MKYPQRPQQKVLFTQEGLEKLKKEYQELLQQRPEAVKELARARELGDLSENGFYKGARAKLSRIDSQLRHVQNLIHSAVISKTIQSDKVDIGMSVTVSDGKSKRIFTVVGSYESNPLEGKISHNSPLGKALLGKKEGETVTVISPNGTSEYRILKLHK